MGEKSAHKKQFIVETARQVFVEKGYKDVTMKDIVDACGISRGGLYLYLRVRQSFSGKSWKRSRRKRMIFFREKFLRMPLPQIFFLCF